MALRDCLDCGADITMRGVAAKRCARCAIIDQATRRRVRVVTGKCVACQRPTGKAAQAKRCAPCLAADTKRKNQANADARSAERLAERGGQHVCRHCGKPLESKALQARRCDECFESTERARKLKLAKRRYYEQPEVFRQRARHYRAKMGMVVVKRTRDWRARNHALLLQRRREQYAANPEPGREAARLCSNKRRAAKRQCVVGKVSRADWEVCKEVFGHRCAYCLRVAALTMDHVEPLARGGAHAIDNIVPACKPCNTRKHARTLLDLVQRFGCAVGT